MAIIVHPDGPLTSAFLNALVDRGHDPATVRAAYDTNAHAWEYIIGPALDELETTLGL